jgi:hypothetical protein
MYTLRIQHSTQDFNGWKKAFDSDPVGRQKSGVRRHQIYRAVENENFVMIDLEFDDRSQAEATLSALRKVWGRVEGNIMMNPQTQIAQIIETKDY